MRFSFVLACVCLMGFNRKRWCWNWMQQGSWVDGPGSIQTPTLQLCPVPFPSFSFPSGPMTEPLNTHRLTDTQIRTPPYTNTNRNIASKTHIHKPQSSTHTSTYAVWNMHTPPEHLLWTVQSSIKSQLLHNLESTLCCAGCSLPFITQQHQSVYHPSC